MMLHSDGCGMMLPEMCWGFLSEYEIDEMDGEGYLKG
jgi:hypothetical protein